MKPKIKTLMTAAIFGLIALAGNSFAQTTTGTAGTTGTAAALPTPAPDVVKDFTTTADAYNAAKDWAGLLAFAQPYVTGTYIAAQPLDGWTDAQRLNNGGIGRVITAIQHLNGVVAAHDYAVSKGQWEAAASVSAYNLKNIKQALVELQNAEKLNPDNIALPARVFNFRARGGENVNAEMVAFIKGQTSPLNSWVAGMLYSAFNTVQASTEDTLAFYNLLLQSVESNQGSAQFIGKLIDQKNKLTK